MKEQLDKTTNSKTGAVGPMALPLKAKLTLTTGSNGEFDSLFGLGLQMNIASRTGATLPASTTHQSALEIYKDKERGLDATSETPGNVVSHIVRLVHSIPERMSSAGQ